MTQSLAAGQNAIPFNVTSFCGIKGCPVVFVVATVDVYFQICFEPLVQDCCCFDHVVFPNGVTLQSSLLSPHRG